MTFVATGKFHGTARIDGLWGTALGCTSGDAETHARTLARFGAGHPQRIAVGERLERINRIAASTGHLARFVVYGSFVTNKPEPNDVDVFLVMDDDFDGDTLEAEAAMLFDHAVADAHFGASVFWVRRTTAFGGEQAMVEYWQDKRGGGQRGIVEIVEDSNDHE